MNHNDIVDRDVIGQYRRRELPAGEVEAFEVHLLDCAECRALLEADSTLERGLRSTAADGIAEPPDDSSTRVRRVYLAIAASIGIFAIAGISSWQTLRAPTSRPELPVFRLAITRGPGADSTEIRVPSGADWYVLELDNPVTDGCCRVVIEDDRGIPVWRSLVELREDEGVVRVILGRSNLHSGKYGVALLSTSGTGTRFVEHPIVLKLED